MAAKMEEQLARQKQAAPIPEATEVIEELQDVQEVVDEVMNEPEPEKPAFFDLSKGAAALDETVARRAVSPVLRNLADLATRADLKFGSDAPCAISDEGVLRVRGQGFARLRDSVCYLGTLEFRPRFKRYKGKDLKTPFGSEQDPIHELVGQGVLYLKPSGKLTMIPLEDEIVYLQEDRVWAFAGDLRWENGRLPGENGSDLLLVQFKGGGHVALRLQHTLRALPLSGEMPALLPAEHVVGWYGEVVPRLTSMTYPGSKEPVAVVEIQGSGHVLFEMPLDEDRHS
jgi:uncharacterized protein (AIM24 family)